MGEGDEARVAEISSWACWVHGEPRRICQNSLTSNFKYVHFIVKKLCIKVDFKMHLTKQEEKSFKFIVLLRKVG